MSSHVLFVQACPLKNLIIIYVNNNIFRSIMLLLILMNLLLFIFFGQTQIKSTNKRCAHSSIGYSYYPMCIKYSFVLFCAVTWSLIFLSFLFASIGIYARIKQLNIQTNVSTNNLRMCRNVLDSCV